MNRLLYVLLWTWFTTQVQAVTFCVSDATELRAALAAAGTNNSFDTIKISVGDYPTNGTAFSFYDEHGHGLEISGGWTQITATPCSAQLGTGLFHTVLDADLSSAVMSMLLTDEASISVSNLAFINGLSSDVAGLEIKKYDPDDVFTGTYTLEHNVFVNNQGNNTSALSLKGFDRLDVRNNLFTDNSSAFSTVLRVEENLGSETVINNNTLVNNDGAVRVYLYGSAKLLLANNTMRSDHTVDLIVFNGPDWYLYNNNIGDFFSSELPLVDAGNFTLPNRFVPGNSQYTPDAGSPLVDAGRSPCGLICPFPRPFTSDWQLGSQALEGENREQGQGPDVGAFESPHNRDIIFMNWFD